MPRQGAATGTLYNGSGNQDEARHDPYAGKGTMVATDACLGGRRGVQHEDLQHDDMRKKNHETDHKQERGVQGRGGRVAPHAPSQTV